VECIDRGLFDENDFIACAETELPRIWRFLEEPLRDEMVRTDGLRNLQVGPRRATLGWTRLCVVAATLAEIHRTYLPSLERLVTAADSVRSVARDYQRKDRAPLKIGLTPCVSSKPIIGVEPKPHERAIRGELRIAALRRLQSDPSGCPDTVILVLPKWSSRMNEEDFEICGASSKQEQPGALQFPRSHSGRYADFRCGLAVGFFAAVSFADFLPAIGMSIAVANTVIEGGHVLPETEELMNEWARGEIDDDELIEQSLKRFGPGA
jgi:Antitoxin VbhA